MLTVWIKGEKRDYEEAVLEGHSLERKRWCEEDLAMFFHSTRCGIKRINYHKLVNGEELIRIYYSDDSDVCYKDCWISGDSYAAIVEDMYRQHVIY